MEVVELSRFQTRTTAKMSSLKNKVPPIVNLSIMAIKLGPLSMLYLLLSIGLFAGGLTPSWKVILIFLFGSVLATFIAFGAGIVIILPIAYFIKGHNTNAQMQFEKGLLVFVSFFGLPIVTSLISSIDSILISICVAFYLSAVTGWYFFTQSQYKDEHQ